MAKYVFLLLLSVAVLAAEAKNTPEPEVHFVPFIAAIVIRDYHICTGAIVDDTSIVTTAFCCTAAKNVTRSVHIKVGSTDYKHGIIYLPDKYRIHPKYDPKSNAHDICVIEVTKKIHWTNEVQKIQLALLNEFHNFEPGLIYKWGDNPTDNSTILKQYRLDFIEPTKCQVKLTDEIEKGMLCVGIDKDQKDSCKVESGAPFVIGGYLVGVKSWHVDCEHPMIHTDIFFYKDFIID